MNLNDIAKADAQKLCANSKRGTDAVYVEISVYRTLRTWETLLAEEPAKARWLLLDAYVARVDVTEEWGSILYAERVSWARSVAALLLEQHSDSAAAAIPQAITLVRRLLGGARANQVLDSRRNPLKAVA